MKTHGNVVATAATLRMIKLILRRTLAPSLAFPSREHQRVRPRRKEQRAGVLRGRFYPTEGTILSFAWKSAS